MAKFTYTARRADGRLERGEETGESRADVVRRLKGRGLIVVGVEAGGVAVTGGNRRRSLCVAGVAAAVLTGAVVFFLQSGPAKKKVPVKREAPVSRSEGARRGAAAQTAQGTKQALPPKRETKQIPAQNTVQAPAAGRAEKSPQDGKLPREAASATNEAPVQKEEVAFRTMSENTLALMASVPPGTPMPPMPEIKGLERDFAIAKTNVITIFDDDSEAVAARKEQVALLKLEIKKMQESGVPPEETLKALENYHNEVARYRTELQQRVNALLADGETAKAKALAADVSKELTELGVPPLRTDHGKPKRRQKQ